MQIVDEIIIDRADIRDSDNYIFDKLKKRCLELIDKHPDKQQLFIITSKDRRKKTRCLKIK